jgi:hypothetical protein
MNVMRRIGWGNRLAAVSRPGATVVACLCLALAAGAGCRSIGPATLPRDRADYSTALADSWKDMMLLNIVKTRYLDLPIFLDVGQVVAGYSRQGSVDINGSFASMGRGNSLGLGAAGSLAEHPTITYTPLTGDKFLTGFLNPVSPVKVFSLVQSGYAVDFILQLSVNSLNGLRNQPISLGSKYTADPEFFRVLELLRDVQDARAVGLRVEHATNGLPATVLFFRGDRIDPEVQAKIAEVRQLLGVAAGESAFRLVASPLRGDAGELGVDTRSVWQMLSSLALGVDIPPGHEQRKLAPPMAEALAPALLLLRIHSGSAPPPDTYVAVPYEGEWFWIANDDWRSKRTFVSILFLFTLADTGPTQNLPTLTIPTR